MRFSVATWNCFGMAQRPLDALLGRRAPFGARLAHADVIAGCASPEVLCVQELLSSEACSFFDRLGRESFQAVVRDENRAHLATGTVRGNGLGIGTRLMLLGSRLFRLARGVGWDRLARKGALYAHLGRPGWGEVDVLTVHLQAGGTTRALSVRARQLAELGRLVGELSSAARPFIVCGDFNIDGSRAQRGSVEYRRMREVLSGFEDLGAVDDHPTWAPPSASGRPAERLDYIWARPAKEGRRLRCAGVDRILDGPVPDGPLGFASDHFGLAASFTE